MIIPYPIKFRQKLTFAVEDVLLNNNETTHLRLSDGMSKIIPQNNKLNSNMDTTELLANIRPLPRI